MSIKRRDLVRYLVRLSAEQGVVLATLEERPAVVLVEYGQGQVLALADVWVLMAGWDGENAVFWENLGKHPKKGGW